MRKISRSTIQQAADLIREYNYSYIKAAKAVGICRRSLIDAAQRYGIELPKRLTAAEKLKEYEELIYKGEISQHALSKKLGIAQPHLSILYKRLGYPALKQGEFSRSVSRKTAEEADAVIAHIMANGGYVPDAIKALNLNIYRATVHRHAKAKGIDLREYRYANQRYGHWRVLPLNIQRAYTADFRVNAQCTLCNSVHSVLMVNLRSGLSTKCQDCARGSRKNQQVKCLETGELFRSIRSFCLSIAPVHRYQTLRNQIKRKKELKFDDKTYVLVTA